MPTATFRIWRGEQTDGKFVDYKADVSEGMVVLDAVHHVHRRDSSPAAQGPAAAVEVVRGLSRCQRVVVRVTEAEERLRYGRRGATGGSGQQAGRGASGGAGRKQTRGGCADRERAQTERAFRHVYTPSVVCTGSRAISGA